MSTTAASGGSADTGTFVRQARDGAVALLRLDRPDRLNAVSEELYADFEAALEATVDDPSVRAVRLDGAGRAFCAGADLKAHADRRRDASQRRAYVWAGQRVCRMLQQLEVPVVAAVHGYAVGAGAEIALSADVVVVADDAQFRLPEVGLGTFPGGGLTQRLPLLIGQLRAKQLILLGESISGADAVDWGLANVAVAADQLEATGLRIAAQLADQPALSSRLAKTALNRAGAFTVDAAMTEEAEALLACMATSEWSSGVRAFAEGGGDGDA